MKILNSKGFTLIESLVALAILSVALIPMYALSTASINLAATIRNNVVAANLAQEGIELFRAVRDDRWFVGGTPFFGGAVPDGVYEIDFTMSDPALTQDRYLLLQANGAYNYTAGGVATAFKRTVTVTNMSPVQVRLQSVVSWTDRRGDRNITIESHLFNWK